MTKTDLSVKVTTEADEDRNFGGSILFENSKNDLFVTYVLHKKNFQRYLNQGDELDITLKLDGEEFRIKGECREVLNEIPERIRCIWSLSYEIIQENMFLLGFGTKNNSVPAEITQSMLKEIKGEFAEVLFGEDILL